MPESAQRLAFISTHTSPLAAPGAAKAGGMNVYLMELTRRLAHMGRAVDIYTRRTDADTPKVVEASPHVRVITMTAGPVAPLDPPAVELWLPAFSAAVCAVAAREQIDYALIHSHYWLSGLAGIALAEAWDCPHLAMFHTLGEVKNRARRAEREPAARIAGEREIVRRADRVICATPHERDFLVELYDADPADVRIVPGGVDLVRFHPGDRMAARMALDLPSGPLALFVGRLEPLKGVDVLIRAAAVIGLEQSLHVVIVGGDDGRPDGERARLLALTHELELADQILFRGVVPHERLSQYYQAADVCVVPSYYESFGLVAVEAQASGTPVIATRVGGLQYTVRDGQTGYLVSWRCPEPFAERLEALLANPDLQQRFGSMARTAMERFDWAAVAAQVAAIYDELLTPPVLPAVDSNTSPHVPSSR